MVQIETDQPTAAIALDHMSMGHGVGRAAILGAFVGFVVMSAVAASIGLYGGLDLRSAIGVGTFAGIWGGPGFGAMFGGITAITRNEQLNR